MSSAAARVVAANGREPSIADSGQPPPSKRVKLDGDEPVSSANGIEGNSQSTRRKGVAPVKEEFLLKGAEPAERTRERLGIDDDAAEGRENGASTRDPNGGNGSGHKNKKQQKNRGQNKEREFGQHADTLRLCGSVALSPEFSPRPCSHGDRCNLTHDLRKYLKDGRRGDLTTFDGICPVWSQYGRCPSGWRCRFVSSHMNEIERDDGRKELILLEDPNAVTDSPGDEGHDFTPGVVNLVPYALKIDLQKRRLKLEKSEKYIPWSDADAALMKKAYNTPGTEEKAALESYRAGYVEPPLRPSEKRRLYFGRETPVLAPLTTQGNLPFRRLCVELGAQATYSEMAFGLPLLQGSKADWTLMRAHESEVQPPRVNPDSATVPGYDNARDLIFGAQISANQPALAAKVTEALAKLVPHLRVIDLNCGCPIEMIFRGGAGSALLDHQAKLEKMIKGMNVVSGEIPISAKIRTGVKDGKPTAQRLIERLAFGGLGLRDLQGPPGCAAVTLHGRSRAQRYTKAADWGYIAECAALIKSYNGTKDDLTDTIRAPDERDLANGKGLDSSMYFLGNGDCYSHVDYFRHLDEAKVDSVMVGRGAIIKPWVFEEITTGQYLDKSGSERLAYIEKFARYGLEAWGSDELGIGFTRRFLLDFLSFFHRYVPIGLLEYLPPSLNDRPPAYRGRDDIETLLASPNYKDWIKISEMFLGPAHPNFKFQPKHKSNSYEEEAEG